MRWTVIPLGQIFHAGISTSSACNRGRWLKQQPEDKGRNVPWPYKRLALWEEQTANLSGLKSFFVFVCEEKREHSGKGSFLWSTKSFQVKGKGSEQVELTVYNCGLSPLEESLSTVVRQQIIAYKFKSNNSFKEKMPFRKWPCILSARSELLCVQIAAVPPVAYYSGLTFCKSTDIRQEAIPAGLPFPRAAAGSPSWPFSEPSLLDRTVPSTERRAHGEQLL